MNDIRQMLRSSSMRTVRSALVELDSLPPAQAALILEDLVGDANPDVRARALWNLAKIAPDRARTWALKLLGDLDATVRWSAVRSIGRINERSAATMVAKLVEHDPDELVQSLAASVLGSIGDASVLPALLSAVKRDVGADHEGVPIRRSAQQAIEQIIARADVHQ